VVDRWVDPAFFVFVELRGWVVVFIGRDVVSGPLTTSYQRAEKISAALNGCSDSVKKIRRGNNAQSATVHPLRSANFPL
jgi:hypothetical protein